jgi:hypothetical protein
MEMRRYVVVLAVLVLSAVHGQAWAQGLSSSLGLDGLQVQPLSKIYYKSLGLNLNFGIPAEQLLSPFIIEPQWGSLLDVFPLELKLTEGRLVVGEIGFQVTNGGRARGFASIAASVPTTAGMESAVGPGIGTLTDQSHSWDGTGLQWWQIDLGGAFKRDDTLEFLVGVKFERTTLKLHGAAGYTYPLILINPLRLIFVQNNADTYGGDVQVNLTIPYVGVRLNNGYFRSTFRIGIAGANVTSPIRLTDSGVYHAFFFLGIIGRSDLSEEARYTFSNSGLYLDGSFEYDFDVSNGFGLTCWAQGTWMSIPGGGNVDLTGQSTAGIFPLLGIFNFPPTSFWASGSSRESGLSEYSLNIGIKGILTF